MNIITVYSKDGKEEYERSPGITVGGILKGFPNSCALKRRGAGGNSQGARLIENQGVPVDIDEYNVIYPAEAPSTGNAILEKLDESITIQKQTLQLITKPKSMKLSALQSDVFDTAINSFFKKSHHVLPTTGKDNSFDWPKTAASEADGTPFFCKKLANYLKLPSRMQLIDVHTRNNIFNRVVCGMTLKGKTDLCITEFEGKYEEDTIVEDVIDEAKMIFELKSTALNIAADRQAIGELLCGSSQSRFELEVCLTNGWKWRFYSLQGSTIHTVACRSWEDAATYIQQRLSALGDSHFRGEEMCEPTGDEVMEPIENRCYTSAAPVAPSFKKSSDIPPELHYQLGVLSEGELRFRSLCRYPDVQMYLAAAGGE